MRGVLAWFRTHGNAAAIRFLTQEGQRHSQRELDELADSLVAIVVSYRSGDPPHRLSAATAASEALGVSGLPGHISERAQNLAARGLPPPVPYQHAFDMLGEVLRRSQPGGIQGGTLWALTQLPDTARAVAFLGEVAASNATLAIAAIHHLSKDTGEAGFVALRRLYESDAVVHPHARENLNSIASARRWQR